jgi:hypothetical protein
VFFRASLDHPCLLFYKKQSFVWGAWGGEEESIKIKDFFHVGMDISCIPPWLWQENFYSTTSIRSIFIVACVHVGLPKRRPSVFVMLMNVFTVQLVSKTRTKPLYKGLKR